MEYIPSRNGRKPWRMISAAEYELPAVRPRRVSAWHEIWRETYDTYLWSPEWREKRSVVLARCEGRCGCGEPATEVHHLTYENVFEEQPHQLLAVCRMCHARYHGFGC